MSNPGNHSCHSDAGGATANHRSRYWLGGVVVLLIAAALRVAPAFTSLPYIDYIDEGHVLQQSIELLSHRTLDTRWYDYPPLPAYLTSIAMLAYSPVYHLRHGHRLRQDLPTEKQLHTADGDEYDLIAPPEIIVAGRLMAVLFSLGTVALTGALAADLTNRRVALLAMLMVAVCPALVSRSSNVIIDTFATFFALLASYLSILMLKEAKRTRASGISLCAGIAAGLAFASKYTIALSFGSVLIAATLHPKHPLRGRLTVAALAGLIVGSVVGSPLIFVKPLQVWHGFESATRNYSTIFSSPGYIGQAVQTAELGWLLVVTGCVGIVLMLWAAKTRLFSVGWLILAAGLFVVLGFRPFQPFRNLLPLVPGLCFASAAVFVKAYDLGPSFRYRAASRILIAIIVVANVWTLSAASYAAIQERMLRQDTRITAIDWLRDNVIRNQRVLVLSELQILPKEWNRVSANVRVAPLPSALRLLEQGTFDYVVSTKFEDTPNLPASKLTQHKAWHSATAKLSVVARFGHVPPPMQPYFWRTNDELILVLRKG
jgi:4-amino-4-deoxy-L-arabinose transferase-like glycosyltransferase